MKSLKLLSVLLLSGLAAVSAALGQNSERQSGTIPAAVALNAPGVDNKLRQSSAATGPLYKTIFI